MTTVPVSCPSCDNSVEIALGQAGTEIQCPTCQSTFDAPTMRELRRLYPDTSSPSPASGERRDPFTWVFVAGLIIAVVGFGLGGWLFVRSQQLIASYSFDEQLKDLTQELDQASPAAVWGTMDSLIKSRDLPEWREAQWRGADIQGRISRAGSYGLFGLGAIGLISSAGALVFRAKKKKE